MLRPNGQLFYRPMFLFFIPTLSIPYFIFKLFFADHAVFLVKTSNGASLKSILFLDLVQM